MSMSRCPGCSHPCAALPAPWPPSPALPDVWRWQPGRFRIPDPSPQPRGRYIIGADATHLAARHSLREARTGAVWGGGGPRRPGGGRHRYPAGPGGRGSAAQPGGRVGRAEPAARTQPLRPGPAGTPAARFPCTVGAGAGWESTRRAGIAAGGGRGRGAPLGWWGAEAGGAWRSIPALRGVGQDAALRAGRGFGCQRSGVRRRYWKTLRGGRSEPQRRLRAGLLVLHPALC